MEEWKLGFLRMGIGKLKFLFFPWFASSLENLLAPLFEAEVFVFVLGLMIVLM